MVVQFLLAVAVEAVVVMVFLVVGLLVVRARYGSW